MSSDDAFRNSQYSANRKSNNKSQVYSPSANYNFNSSQTLHGNHNNNHGNHGNHGNHSGNNNYGNQQQQRRKSSNFKQRDNHNSNDRIIKQNDIIIRLLKEIRDRLPPDPSAPSYDKHDNNKGRKHSGRNTPPKQENESTESAEQCTSGNKASVDETPAAEKPVQENLLTETADSAPLKNELEDLDNAVNGNQK